MVNWFWYFFSESFINSQPLHWIQPTGATSVPVAKPDVVGVPWTQHWLVHQALTSLHSEIKVWWGRSPTALRNLLKPEDTGLVYLCLIIFIIIISYSGISGSSCIMIVIRHSSHSDVHLQKDEDPSLSDLNVPLNELLRVFPAMMHSTHGESLLKKTQKFYRLSFSDRCMLFLLTCPVSLQAGK